MIINIARCRRSSPRIRSSEAVIARHRSNLRYLKASRAQRRESHYGEYYQSWIERKLPPLVRPSRTRDYRNHFCTYILPRMAEVELAALSLEHLEDLRLHLHAKQGLGLKTVRNVIDGSLRAMFRDARKAGLAAGFPFSDLEWPRRIVPGPDPFTEDESDRLLKYFLHKRWRLGRHQGRYQAKTYFPYNAFLFTLFYTGMGPPEGVALRVKSLDVASGTLFVERSRSLRAEAAPETAAAARVVRLTPRNVEVLHQLIDLRAEPDDYVFKNTLGEPIDQRSFYSSFARRKGRSASGCATSTRQRTRTSQRRLLAA